MNRDSTTHSPTAPPSAALAVSATRAPGAPWARGATGSGECAILVEGLRHYFGHGELRKQVLFDVDFICRAGEIVIMTGPSGSGKTTLLTLIGALRTAQEGVLQVLGQELRGADPARLVEARRRMGFIFQAHNLFDSLTAAQNVGMALELFGVPARQRRERAVAMLTRLGLEHRAQYKPAALSGGQKQRVAIARGLVHGPRLVLADEPTAALDERSGREVVTLFQQLAREEGCAIVMVTHDNRVLDVADRIVNMVEGRVKSDVNVVEATIICEFLRECPVFAKLAASALTETADRMKIEEHPAGAVIIRQGDVGDKFYLLRRGEVEVLATDEQGATRKLAALFQGDYFGEVALLTGAPRNATVRAVSNVRLYSLAKEHFQAVLQASATFEEELRRALFARQ